MVNIFESIGFKKFIKNRRIICFSVEISWQNLYDENGTSSKKIAKTLCWC
jgi:hypothetical protein